MQSLFLRTLVDEIRMKAGDRVLVGLSGGVDSMVLLDLLLGAADALGIEVRAAHLDHAMRPESARDAMFVQDYCRRRQVPLCVERRDIPAVAAARRQGLEEAARDERRTFLQQTALSEGCNFIALGHHRDDQAETFLHRLLRGTGLSGLAGMRLRSGPVIRPLLVFSRSDLLGYLQARSLPHIEDPSNADPRYTRNRLRHRLLPALRTYNPRIDEHLARLSRRIALEEDWWDLQVARQLEDLCTVSEDGFRLPVEALAALHPALRARVLRGALEMVRGDLRKISARHLEMLEGLLTCSRPEAEIDLPGAWAARRYQRLWLRSEPPPAVGAFAIEVPGPGVYDLPGGGRLQVCLRARCEGEDLWAVEFDAEAVRFPLRVRNFRPGDRFHPCGGPGRRKLKDFFIDLKLDRETRHALPLVIGEEILWLPGVRRCHGFRPRPDGAPVLRLAVSGLAKGNQSL